MVYITKQELSRLREVKWRQKAHLKIRDERGAINFINDLGFILLFSVKGIDMPALAQATKPRPGEDWVYNAWEWKNLLPQAKRCAYAKIIHHKGTFISWQFYPKFYCLWGRRSHYLDDYYDGLLSIIERQIMDILSERGAMDTEELKKLVGLPAGKRGTAEFHRALESLQSSFRVTIAGGNFNKSWGIHIWDTVENWAPDYILDEAFIIKKEDALEAIILKQLQNMVAAPIKAIANIFKQPLPQVKAVLDKLQAEGKVIEVSLPGEKENWVMFNE